jgi:hypothetical protein
MVLSSHFNLKLFLSSDHGEPAAPGAWLLAFGFWLSPKLFAADYADKT